MQSLGREGFPLSRDVLPIEPISGAVVLGPLAPGTEKVELSTPRHSRCVVAIDGDATCVLVASPVVRPFGSSPGRIWIRSGDDAPFSPVPPLDRDWGEEGFVLPPGRFDAVVAREGSGALLSLQTTAAAIGEAIAPGPAAWELRGRLVNADGTPFAGAFSLAVEVLPRADPRSERRNAWAAFYAKHGVETGPRNAFRVAPLAAEPLTFQVRMPGKPAIRFGTFRQGAGRTVDVGALRVLPGGRLTVSLRLETQTISPEAQLDVQVRLLRPDPGTVAAGAEGRPEPLGGRIGVARPLVLSGLPYGTYSVALSAGELYLGTENVTVLAETAVLECAVTDETVAGRVTDMKNDPLPDALIEIHRPARVKATTDENGRFSATFPHAGGDVVVWAALAGGVLPLSKIVDPRAPESRDLVFSLPAFEIEASIRAAADGNPVPDALLLVEVQSEGRRSTLTLKPDAEGVVRARGLPDARTVVRASARGYSEWGPRDVVLSARNPKESLDIRMRKTGVISGVVVSGTGAPIPGAFIHGPMRGSAEATSAQTVAGLDGRFEVEIPEDRPSVLGVWARGYRLGFVTVTARPDSITVELQPIGAHADIEVRTVDGGELERAGWVLLAGGMPVDDMTVEQSFLSNGCPRYALTRSRLRLGGCLMPGSYALLLTTWDGKRKENFLTDYFDPTRDAVLRVIARPR